MLFLLSWLLPNTGRYLLPLAFAPAASFRSSLPLPHPKCLQRVTRTLKDSALKRLSALMGDEGIWILKRAAPSLRNWIQCSYFYANSLANER